MHLGKYDRDFHERGTGYFYSGKIWLNAQKYLFLQEIIDSKTNNMKKNFVKSRWFFTMLLFVTTMIMPSMMLAEESITPTRPKGDGKTEPYQISNAAELYWFARLVNGKLENEEQDLSANAILTSNIIVNTGVLDENKNLASKGDLTEWEPIGTRWSPYTGTFDGKGYTISGLYFNNPTSSYVGLFGCIGADGKISNVGVLDSYFQFSALGGGVCGVNYGTVRDCKNTGSVRGFSTIGGVCGLNEKGGIIENSFNEGTVSGTGDNAQQVGGVSGYNNGTIKSCYNTASVSGQESVGGVCGFNSVGTTTNCFNEGTVSGKNIVGGVCGNGCGVATTNCFNEGTVSGQSHVGGVCGYDYYYDGALTNCYYLSDTATGGINGKDVSGKAEKKPKEQFESGEVAWLLNGKGVGEQVWGQLLGRDQYPVLGSDNKVIKAAQGDKDANGNDTYWATFSNPTNDVTLSVPAGRNLNVYNATVSGGKMTLTERDNQVAKEEGVLLKTDGEYVNAKANETNDLTKASSYENHLVATPAEAKTVTAETGCKLYRLTYNKAEKKEGLGFYLGVDDGKSLKATPGKAYLKVSEDEAKDPSSAALTRSFVFGGGNETTGIEGITIMGTDVQRHGTIEGIFDLQGRKIVNPTKGIYIKNNKKVVIK